MILCGTDFSDHAERAVRAAAAFARAFREPLLLVHVVDRGAVGWVAGSVPMACVEAASERLARIAAALAAPDLALETQAVIGVPDEELATLARERHARMLVVGVLGTRAGERWRVGSLAARLAHAAPVPVLLVLAAEPFEECARGGRAMRVLLAADFTTTSDAAMAWLPALRQLGPCDAVLQHLYDPVAERRRLGFGAASASGRESEIEAHLLRDLHTRMGEPGGPGTTVTRVAAWPSWVAEGLIEIAEQERFDLIVVGGRRRGGLAKVRHDSVSDRLLRRSPTSVLRIPFEGGDERSVALARLARILATTDLSPLGNAILSYAYSLVAPGGTVHLLHVIEDPRLPNPLYAHYETRAAATAEERVEEEREVERRLRGLVPAEAERRGIDTRVAILRDGRPADLIRTHAERLDVEAVCMATHGRSGLSKLVAGSVAAEVAAASTRPLVLVRPASEE